MCEQNLFCEHERAQQERSDDERVRKERKRRIKKKAKRGYRFFQENKTQTKTQLKQEN